MGKRLSRALLGYNSATKDWTSSHVVDSTIVVNDMPIGTLSEGIQYLRSLESNYTTIVLPNVLKFKLARVLVARRGFKTYSYNKYGSGYIYPILYKSKDLSFNIEEFIS